MSSKAKTSPRTQSLLEAARQAEENQKRTRPSIVEHSIPASAAAAIEETVPLEPAYDLAIDETRLTARRLKDTNYALVKRDHPDRESLYRLPYWGETCLDLRWWVVSAELQTDLTVDIVRVSDAVRECILSTTPPEWEETLADLLDKYQ